MDGILNINKPPGKTSFSIVAMVKRLTGERRVGHAGTLDPAAVGVLPVCIGRATRIVEFLVDATKTYRAEIELGIITETYDGSGHIVQRGDASRVNQNKLESALAPFRGTIWQTPPMYSAVKYQGKPLYELARAGITVERRRRPAEIHHLDLIGWQSPVATIEVDCGKGTYIRSLAHDLGQALGCGAYLKSLVRLRCGIFDLKDAISIPQLEVAFHSGYWQHYLHPVDSVLLHWAAVVVSDEMAQNIRNGRSVVLKSSVEGKIDSYPEQYIRSESANKNHCRVYALDGSFLGVLHFNSESGQWHPEKVFY